MNWLTTAILAIIFLSAYNFVLKLTADKISNFYGLPLIAFGALIMGIIGTLLTKVFRIGNLTYTNKGVLFALATGLIWGIGELFFFLVFTKNTPLSIGLPIVIGGLIMVGSILGTVFLNEPLTMAKAGGVLAILLGIILLAR